MDSDTQLTVGASQVPALMGTDPFKSAGDVWHELKHGIRHGAGEAAEIGKLVEPLLIDWGLERLGLVHDEGYVDAETQVRTQERIYLDGDDCPLHATCDAVVYRLNKHGIGPEQWDRSMLAEAKTTGLAGQAYGAWGAEGTDDVPPWVYDQCQAQMACAGLAECYVFAWVGGVCGRRIYRLQRDVERIDDIVDTVRTFAKWLDGDQAPPSATSLATLRAVPRRAGKHIELTESPKVDVEWPTDFVFRSGSMNAFDAYDWLGQLERAAKDRREVAHAAILQAMGDATSVTVDGWFAKIGNPYQRTTVKANDLKLRAPDLFKELATVTDIPGRLIVKATADAD